MGYKFLRELEEWFGPVVEFLKFTVFLVCMLAVLSGLAFPFVYHSCKVEAQIVNTEFGTSYTAGDIFWAGETIENIVIGQKARIDLNDARE